MKGFFFAKPLEFRLETPSESLVQGEKLEGTLKVSNRGADEVIPALEVGLSYGIFKKIKANEDDAFQPIERLTLAQDVKLPTGGEHDETWSIPLASDCPITSIDGALFLLYGRSLDQPGDWSKLDLRVEPLAALKTFVTTLENHFAFTATSSRYSKGFTEVKFKAPSSYPTVEELVVKLRVREAEGLEVQFNCKTRKFERGPAGGLTSVWVKREGAYPAADFLRSGGLPDRVFFKNTVEALLRDAAPPPIK